MHDTILDFIDSNIIFGLKGKGQDITQRGHYIIFTGGGSLCLKNYLEEELENNKGNMSFSTTAQWDNCISYIIKDLSDIAKQNGLQKEAQLLAKKILSQTDFSSEVSSLIQNI